MFRGLMICRKDKSLRPSEDTSIRRNFSKLANASSFKWVWMKNPNAAFCCNLTGLVAIYNNKRKGDRSSPMIHCCLFPYFENLKFFIDLVNLGYQIKNFFLIARARWHLHKSYIVQDAPCYYWIKMTYRFWICVALIRGSVITYSEW